MQELEILENVYTQHIYTNVLGIKYKIEENNVINKVILINGLKKVKKKIDSILNYKTSRNTCFVV